MTERPLLLEMRPDELEALVASLGQPGFRARQVWQWLMKGADFAQMSNLPAALRAALAEAAVAQPVTLHEAFASQKDDTVKFLFALRDGNLVEGVLMRYHYGYTLCVSTQVGCRMGCAFCASTLGGCVRSLSAGEMLGEVLCANTYLGDRGRVGHVVLMGSGEPLDNYDSVVAFLRLLSREDGLNLSLRNVSLSTCGLVPKLYDLAGEGLPVTLSVSLHAPNDDIRRQIMPIAKVYPLPELMEAVRNYVRVTGRRVVFEYALIDGLNSDPRHARELSRLVSNLQCHVNLIPLNHVEEREFRPSTAGHMKAFIRILEGEGVNVTVRRRLGGDVDASCGQLRRKMQKK